eukprot:2106248-Prymnesium_polylepis.1
MSEDDHVRGPLCVALPSKKCKAAPDRDTQISTPSCPRRIASSMASAPRVRVPLEAAVDCERAS